MFRYIAEFPEGDVTRDDSQRRYLAQHRVQMLEQCCSLSKRCRNNVVTLCCANITFKGLLEPSDYRLCQIHLS